jgi:hypothetical protein
VKEMTEKAGPPTRNVSSFLLLMILIVLVVSVGFLYFGVEAVISGNGINAGYFMLIGFIGLSLLAYMLLQAKRKPLRGAFEIPQVITTILCQKCGFKNVRDFQRGDYIFKETEPCPKCNEKMMIASIYREVKEKEK